MDILKIDIEGAEFPLMESMDWNDICVGQLLIEIHPKEKPMLSLWQLAQDFLRLETDGFRLFSAEPVCLDCRSAMEVSFLHKDWTPGLGRQMFRT